ncbi:MAG: hypothetical protein NDI61_06480 [Bdellovibrionaceae bacterium]|nr:hypothetical protein [Pseudobdellovibrionaceae bacterium]
MNMLTRKKLFAVMCVSFVCLLVVFQNCSPLNVSFKSLNPEKPLASLGAELGNGGEYGGKPEGVYYRFVPDFTCEALESPAAVLTINSETDVHYRENSQFKCGLVDGPLPIERVTRSRMQNDVVSYQAIPFERKDTAPSAIPANLVEAWCRDLSPGALFEIVSHFDRTQKQAVARIYQGQESTTGSVLVNITPDAPVTRLVSSTQVHLRGNDFDLLIDRRRFSPAVGEFLADFERGGTSRTLSCALGGALDPNVWPNKLLLDAPLFDFDHAPKISPDRSTFAFESSLEPRTPSQNFLPNSYTPSVLKNGVLKVYPALATFFFGGYGNRSTYHYSPDSSILLFNTQGIGESAKLYRLSGTQEPISIAPLWTEQAGQLHINPTTQQILYAQPTAGNFFQIMHSTDTYSSSSLVFQSVVSDLSDYTMLYSIPGLGKILTAGSRAADPTLGQTFQFDLMNWDGTDRRDVTVSPPGVGWASAVTQRSHWIPGLTGSPRFYESDVLPQVFIKPEVDTCSFLTRMVHLRTYQQIDSRLNSLPWMGSGDWLVMLDVKQPPCDEPDFVSGATPRLFNALSGAQLELPDYQVRSLIWNPAKNAVLGFQTMTGTQRTRWMRVNLETLTPTELCPAHEGNWLSTSSFDAIVVRRDDSAIAASYSAGRIHLYSATPDGRCSRVNSFPVTETPNVHHLTLAPNDSAVVVRTRLYSGGPQQLVYVPLNGAPPIQITSPRVANTTFFNVDFVGKDLDEVVFTMKDSLMQFRFLYSWKIPKEPAY